MVEEKKVELDLLKDLKLTKNALKLDKKQNRKMNPK